LAFYRRREAPVPPLPVLAPAAVDPAPRAAPPPGAPVDPPPAAPAAKCADLASSVAPSASIAFVRALLAQGITRALIG
jgi:hypothetical protein